MFLFFLNSKADPSKYAGLNISGPAKELLEKDPEKFKKLCNGVGSKVNWLPKLGRVGDFICWTLYKLTPNTVWGLNITPSSDLHDVDYAVPNRFASRADALGWKGESDDRLLDNMKIQILRRKSWKWVEKGRLLRAENYHIILTSMGEASFLADKIIEEEDLQPHQD